MSDMADTISFQTLEDFLDFRDNWFVGTDRYGRSVYRLAGRTYSEEQAASILGGEWWASRNRHVGLPRPEVELSGLCRYDNEIACVPLGDERQLWVKFSIWGAQATLIGSWECFEVEAGSAEEALSFCEDSEVVVTSSGLGKFECAGAVDNSVSLEPGWFSASHDVCHASLSEDEVRTLIGAVHFFLHWPVKKPQGCVIRYFPGEVRNQWEFLDVLPDNPETRDWGADEVMLDLFVCLGIERGLENDIIQELNESEPLSILQQVSHDLSALPEVKRLWVADVLWGLFRDFPQGRADMWRRMLILTWRIYEDGGGFFFQPSAWSFPPRYLHDGHEVYTTDCVRLDHDAVARKWGACEARMSIEVDLDELRFRPLHPFRPFGVSNWGENINLEFELLDVNGALILWAQDELTGRLLEVRLDHPDRLGAFRLGFRVVGASREDWVWRTFLHEAPNELQVLFWLSGNLCDTAGDLNRGSFPSGGQFYSQLDPGKGPLEEQMRDFPSLKAMVDSPLGQLFGSEFTLSDRKPTLDLKSHVARIEFDDPSDPEGKTRRSIRYSSHHYCPPWRMVMLLAGLGSRCGGRSRYEEQLNPFNGEKDWMIWEYRGFH